MATNGEVNITILDGGSQVVVPGANVQVVIGTAISGPIAQVVATSSPQTLANTFVAGQLVEAAALTCTAGGTVLAMRATTNAKGTATSVVATANGTSVVTVITGAVGGNITAATNAVPIAITTTTAHTLQTGAFVTIAGATGNTAANGTWVITQTGASTFSLNGSSGNGAWISGGTTTTEPTDDSNVQILIVNGGTIGSAGITYQVSLDAGRNYGPVLSLAATAAPVQINIPNTGINVSFAAGTVAAGDKYQFSTAAAAWNTGGIQACLTALQASPYALAGWGSMHIVGSSSATSGQSAGMTGADASTIQGYLDTMASPNFIYTRAIVSARDSKTPIVWGGTGETEATWITSVTADYSATGARRICANGGYYNIPSAFPNAFGGACRYRRPLAWALAAREVTIPPQRHAGRVRDGSLSKIVIDPTKDPLDGFVYHDERQTSGLDVARFSSARTRVGLQGFYITNPNLMSPGGSVFTLLPLGNVMDIACTIVHTVGQQVINADVLVNAGGTIYENDARSIETALNNALQIGMTSQSMISSAKAVVDRTTNVLSTQTVTVVVTIVSRGYVLQENVTVGYASPLAATAGA